jgi:DNA helicase-2/ATP-dependent DNA helicase PcrA
VRLKVLTAAEAAIESRLAASDGIEPSFGGIAMLLRGTVALKGGVHVNDLLDRVATEAAIVGLEPAAAWARAHATLLVLEAAGDLAVICSEEGRIVVSPPQQTIRLSASSGIVVGGTEFEWILGDQSTDGSVLRTVTDVAQARTLDDYLGSPGYRAALRKAGIPDHVDLGLAAEFLVDAARETGTSVTVDASDIWGKLEDDVCYGIVAGNREAVFVLIDEGHARAIICEDIACWMAIRDRGIGLLTEWSLPQPMPIQFRRALAALGRPKDDSLLKWSIDDYARDRLAAWAQMPIRENNLQQPDLDQDAVVAAMPESRLLVEAPPGTGKTWVACRRVGSLVERGVSPARIWMISFTRTAVAEMRSRIASFLGEPLRAHDVRIVTIDSLAWSLRKGFTGPDDTLAAGHEAGIYETLAMLGSGDVQLLDFVKGIEHVIVDEAQDLTGDRCRLITALVARLSPSCGVTVFEDQAQAIYGFSDQQSGPSLARRLFDDPNLGFERRLLRTDHRTKNTTLNKLFEETRSIVTRVGLAPVDRYNSVRSAIEGMADQSMPMEQGGSGTLVLFRSRAEMLVASSELWASRSEFRVRFTGRQEIVQSWIGALLASCRSNRLERRDFDTLWLQLRPIPILPRDAAWSKLRRIAGTGNSSVDLHRLAERLLVQLPPLEVQQTDLGPPTGPLLTTIHGAKGREADEVRLMLSRRPENEPKGGWDEEARVLFVGATRARSRLALGSSSTFLRRQEGTGRRWQRWAWGGRSDARAEIGLDGDIDPSPPVMADDGTNDIQVLLWKHSWRPLALRAEREDGIYVLRVDEGEEEGRLIGRMTNAFSMSLRNLAVEANGEGAFLPRRIRGFHMVAARTVASSSVSEEPRFWLSPVIAGLPVVYLNGGRQNGDSSHGGN